MGILNDLDTLTGGNEPAAAPQESSFKRGLRSGGLSAMGQANALTGGVAQKLGANDFANDRFAASQDYEAQAQAAAPRITRYQDVRGLGDAWDYTTGLIGSSIPVSAAALGGAVAGRFIPGAAGAAGLRSALGSTAATAPFETGEAVQRQMATDPNKPIDLAEAGRTGVASAGLQSVVPTMVAGKLAGPALRGADRSGVLSTIGKNAAVDIPLEAATEAGGTFIQQRGATAFNPNRDTSGDIDELKQAAVGGAAAGGGFAAVGAAGDLTRSGVGAVMDSPGRATQTVKDLGQSALDTGRDALQAGQEAAQRVAGSPQVAAGLEGLSSASQAALSKAKGALGATHDYLAEVAPDLTAAADDTAAWMAKPVEEQVKRAREIYKDFKEKGWEGIADDVAAELDKAGKAVGGASNRAFLFTADAARKAKTDEGREQLGKELGGAIGRTARRAKEAALDLRKKFEQQGDPAEAQAADVMESLGDDVNPTELAGAAPDVVEAKLAQSDEKLATQAGKFAESLLARTDVEPEIKERLTQAASDLTNKTGRAFIAAQTKAAWARDEGVRLIDKLYTKYAKPTETKKSLISDSEEGDGLPPVADGIRKALASSIVPIIEARYPGLMKDPDRINRVGEVLRGAMQDAMNGAPLETDDREYLRALLGDRNTANALRAMYHATVLAPDVKKEQAFFNELNEIEAAERDRSALKDFVGQNLTKEMQGVVKTTELETIAENIQAFVDGSGGAFRTPAEETYHLNNFKQQLDSYFGPKAKVVLAKFEAARKKQKLIQDRDAAPDAREGESDDGFEDDYDSYGNDALGERDTDNRYFGSSRKPTRKAADMKFMDSEKVARTLYPNQVPAIMQRRMELIEEFGNKRVEKITGRQYQEETGAEVAEGDLARLLLVVRGVADGDTISEDTFRDLKLKSNYKDSKAAIRITNDKAGEDGKVIPGLVLDAVKITRLGNERLKERGYEQSAEGDTRKAQEFAEGLAAATMFLDRKINVKPETVIYQADGRKITYAEAEKLISKPGSVVQEGQDEEVGDGSNKTEPIDEYLKQEGLHNVASDAEVHLAMAGGKGKRARSVDASGMEFRHDGPTAPFTFRTSKDENGKPIKVRNALTEQGRQVLKSRAETLEKSVVASVRNMGKALKALSQADMTNGDAHRLYDLTKPIYAKASDQERTRKEGIRRDVIRELFDKYRGKQAQAKPAAKKEAAPEVAAQAKKSRLIERARSSDPELIRQINEHTEVKGLQRSVEALNDWLDTTEGLSDADIDGAARVIDTFNRRIAALTADEDTAYAATTKKYSLVSNVVHEGLERTGIAAAHDSPHRFDGRFNWRANKKRGEGQMTYGAGTYLSTTDEAHKFYKGQFSAHRDRMYVSMEEMRARKSAALEASLTEALKRTDLSEEERSKFTKTLDGVKTALTEMRKQGLAPYRTEVSPTYHVTIDADPTELLDWNENVVHQDPFTQDVLKDLVAEAAEYIGEPESRITGSDVYGWLSDKLGSDEQASEWLQERGIVGHFYTSNSGSKNYVIFDDSRISTNWVQFSKQGADRSTVMTSAQRKEIKDWVEKVLPGKIRLEYGKLKTAQGQTYAGEFVNGSDINGIMRLSVTALDPMSVAYHEAMHAFIHQLRARNQGSVVNELLRAASTPHVQKQLRELLKNQPAALGQLTDPEERAAYMYQFFTATDPLSGQPMLTLNDKSARGVIQMIKDFLKGVMGIWTNEQNAQRIMDYFTSGEYAKGIGDRNAVAAVLEGPRRNKALKAVGEATKLIAEMGERVYAMGHSRLRDTNIPALIELADLVKRDQNVPGKDNGWIPAARIERTQWTNKFAEIIKDLKPEEIDDVLQALQLGDAKKAATSKTRVAGWLIRSKVLDPMFEYVTAAGVDLGDMGYKAGYFPRVWDPAFISKNLGDFEAMLDKYVAKKEITATQKGLIINKLMTGLGAELDIEVDRPGMMNAKQRSLSFIAAEDALPFVKKDLFSIMDSYITQATRRAEWARRFNDDNSGMEALLTQAVAQGATANDVDTARDYMRGVNGTLGDAIDPRVRRIMGDMIVYQNIRLLPLAIFSSVVDPMGIVVRGGQVSDAWAAFKRGIREIPASYKKNPERDESYAIAELMGTIENSLITNQLGQLYSQGMVGATAQKINDKFFKWNLMEQFNLSMRVAATESAINFIARHAALPSEHSERFMKELGLDPAKVPVMNGALVYKKADLVAMGMSDADATAMSNTLRAAVNQWVDGAILRPDAADRPIWFNDPRWALVSHLKQFTYSFTQTILGRVAHEFENGNYKPAMALVSYVPIMIAADLVKGLLQGGGELPEWKQNWDVGDYVWSGIQRAGLLGVGQFAEDGYSGIVGPTIEQLTDVIQVADGRRRAGQVVIEAMPANSLYRYWVDDVGQPDRVRDR